MIRKIIARLRQRRLVKTNTALTGVVLPSAGAKKCACGGDCACGGKKGRK